MTSNESGINMVADILVKLEDLYKKAAFNNKTNIKSMSENHINQGYDTTVKKIEDEFKSYKDNSDAYSILSVDLKQKKLKKEITNYYNKFVKNVESLVSPNYYTLLEMELNDIEKARALEQEHIDFLTNNIVALIDPSILPFIKI